MHDHFNPNRNFLFKIINKWARSENIKVGRRIEGGKKTGKRGNPNTKRKSCSWILKESLVIEAHPWNIGVKIKKFVRKIQYTVESSRDASRDIQSITSINKDVSLIQKWWGDVAATEKWWERIVMVGI